jgi:hypothetical protein
MVSLNNTCIGFIIWDILVALSVLLHQHCLVLIGLWKKRENDIETIEEAKRRIHMQIQKKKYMKRAKEDLKIKEDIKRLEELEFESEDSEENFRFSNAPPLEGNYY